MNISKLVPVLFLFGITSSATALDSRLGFVVPNDYCGALYLIGVKSVSGEFSGEMRFSHSGVLIKRSIGPLKGKSLREIGYKRADGSKLHPADADTYDDNVHIWNVGLGTGTIHGVTIEYVVCFVGTKKERDAVPLDIVDIGEIYKIFMAEQSRSQRDKN